MDKLDEEIPVNRKTDYVFFVYYSIYFDPYLWINAGDRVGKKVKRD